MGFGESEAVGSETNDIYIFQYLLVTTPTKALVKVKMLVRRPTAAKFLAGNTNKDSETNSVKILDKKSGYQH